MTRMWAPNGERIASSQIMRFMLFVRQYCGVQVGPNYFSLHRWSVENPQAFWRAVWDFCEVQASEQGEAVLLDADKLPGARWFPQARLNFAENLLRFRDERTALVGLLENGERRSMTYAELYRAVAQFAAALRKHGVVAGDRVAGFMPNVEETVVAMLATASIGAVWSSCSPDFGADGVVDRFGQIAPRVLVAADGYYYNGKSCDCLDTLARVVGAIDSIECVVVVPVLGRQPAARDPDGLAMKMAAIRGAQWYGDFLDVAATAVSFTQLPFDHPLYVMFSSGTTGKPKCIVHGAGGTLLQHLKEHRLAVDLGRDDVFFYFTTCGWMMWNWLVSGLASGCTLVLFDGAPLGGDGRMLLDAIDQEGISIFGTSARYIAGLEKAGHKPRNTHNLATLKTLLSTGSPLAHESFDYVYRDFKEDVCLSSISGGTDILSCFVGGSPILPVHRGEITAPGLGMAVAIWDDAGNPLKSGKGELVCTRPFPSCPLGFWDDADNERFHAAYFERFAGVWCQGDYAELTAHGGYIVHGRSDAVLNPGGVRIGTAEIYRQVEQVDEVLESVVVGQQWQGDVRILLFVVLRAGCTLDAPLRDRIRQLIRQNTTARHVPALIVQVDDIPRTRSGKIAELAVRDAIHGRTVANTQALANPEALELYRNLPELTQ
ncbi:MAG: acetoacetate--CoA ligase [Gammaproteobacteria bacterium]|nr:acetoacetate--CoA ligase [Gammaproteobacteria bacterium]